MYYLPVSCQHCDNPECVSVCPTGASYKRDDGVVLVDHSKCIGCQYCVMACPYGVRAYDTGKDKGVIEKCTMCAHLIDKGEKPACVKHCPGQARKFGDLDDPDSSAAKAVAAAGAENCHQLDDPRGLTMRTRGPSSQDRPAMPPLRRTRCRPSPV